MIRILVADDEELERMALRKIMEKNGLVDSVTIDEARNGREILEMVVRNEYDVVFMDIRMPGMDGLEVAEILRDRGIMSPIVIISAYDAFSYAQKAIKLGVYEYLLKPAGADVVLAALGHCLNYNSEIRKFSLREKQLETVSSEIAKTLETAIVAQMATNRIQRETIRQYLSMRDIERMAVSALVFRFQHFLAREKDPIFSSLFQIAASAAREASDRLGFRLIFSHDTSVGKMFVFFPSSSPREINPDNGERLSRIGFERSINSDNLWPIIKNMTEMLRKTAPVELFIGLAGPVSDGFETLLEAASKACELAYKACPIVRVSGKFGISSYKSQKQGGFEKEFATMGNGSSTSRSNFENRVIEFVNKHYMDDINLETLAAMVGISTFHLSHKLASELGIGFKEILSRTRTNKAKELLRGGASIKEASFLVGYRDQAYFSRVFRRTEGQSPKEFIENTAKKYK
jgi:two-component system response regulator YesN